MKYGTLSTPRSVIETEESQSGSPGSAIRVPSTDNKSKVPEFLAQTQIENIFRESYITAEYCLVTRTEKLGGIYVIPSYQSSYVWFGVMFVHQGPYLGGVFRFVIHFQEGFPTNNTVPTIAFQPPVYHPCVHPLRGVFDIRRHFKSWSKANNHVWQLLRAVKAAFHRVEMSTFNKAAHDMFLNTPSEFAIRAQKEAELSVTRIYDPPSREFDNDPHWIKFSPYDPKLHDQIRAKALKPVHRLHGQSSLFPYPPNLPTISIETLNLSGDTDPTSYDDTMEEEFEEERGWTARSTTWEDDTGNQSDGENGDEPMDNPEQVRTECLEKFSSEDYIMEPGIFNQLKRYFQAGGSPEQVIELLSKNYVAYAQMANLMAEWIISAGTTINEVRSMVETSLCDMIIKTFDPKKADTIFSEEGETPAWLTELIEHQTWRSLVYRLAEEYPDCLMLNFTIKLISDAGYQGEITSISTAAQQIEVFSRMLKTSVCKLLSSNEDTMMKNIKDTAEMICHSEHTFVYSQVLLYYLMQEAKGSHLMKRLSQEIVKCAFEKGHDVTPVIMALNGSTAYPRACQALASMLSRNALNPADITVLYKMFNDTDPPPVDLIRAPQFLELLIDALFKPNMKLNQEHKPKYIYLLAYAASVSESFRRSQRHSLKQDELKLTIQAIEKAITSVGKPYAELVGDLPVLYSCIKYSVVAVGVIRWVEAEVMEPSYFKLRIEHTPIHLVLLDEVVSCHLLLQQKVLDLIIKLFESKQDELEILVQLELRKVLLDRMVHLLGKGHVIPVLKYIKQCWSRGDTDISLIRYFIMEVLELIAPPYSAEFVALFLPMVEDDEITGMSRGTGDGAEHDIISEFIVHCHAQPSEKSK